MGFRVRKLTVRVRVTASNMIRPAETREPLPSHSQHTQKQCICTQIRVKARE